MTKADLRKIISKKTDISQDTVSIVLETLLETVKESLIKGTHIEIRRFGTFKVSGKKPMMARNPKTGKLFKVPQRTVPVMKFSKQLKQAVDAGVK